MSRLSTPKSLFGGLVALVLGFAFVGVISSCLITIGIWPGQLKLLAPLFCTDAQPDPFVVSDTFSPRPGETVTNFSLYCMGPRGDATDHGFMIPFLIISAVNGALIFGALFLLTLPRALRRRRADRDDDSPGSGRPEDFPTVPTVPPGSTAGPFVD